jgi:outer membrane protein assembly factor BamB
MRRLPLALLVVLGALVGFVGTSAGAGVVLAGDQTVESNHDSNTAGSAEAFRTTAGTSGTAQTITVYVDSTSTATSLTAGLYADASGHPGALLGQGTIAAPAKGAWDDVPISGAAVTAGATYWIAILGPSGAGTIQFRDKSGGGASETSSSSSLSTLPASWTTGARYTDGPLSAYVSGSTSPAAALQLSTNAITFSATAGGVNPGAAQVTVSNSGAGTLSFTASSDSSWLSVTPTSGTAPATLTVAASVAGLSAGTYTGHVTVTAPGATGSPGTVTVTLNVSPQAAGSPSDWLQVDRDSARTGDAVNETGITTSNAGTLKSSWTLAVDGKVTAQPLFAKGVTVAGAVHDVLIVATSENSVYAIDAVTGAQLWKRNFGAEGANCGIPGGFGVTGAPVIDKANGRVYAVSDNGTLYSLALADGSDAAAPMPLVPNPDTNKVWGGLQLRGGDLYFATASDGCDTAPWRGRVYHLGVGGPSPQLLGTWDVVPSIAAPNGGGGIWGYGGVSLDASGHVYAATAADSNETYTQWADRMVELTSGLSVLGSYLPSEPSSFPCAGAPCDLDFASTPTIFQPTGCPTFAAAGNKNGNLYVFDTSVLAASGSPSQILTLNTDNDSLGNGGVGGSPAFWHAGQMLFIGDAGPGANGVAAGLVGLAVQPDCSLKVAWSQQLGGNGLPNSTVTVADGVVFIGIGNGGAVDAFDAKTGASLWSSGSFGTSSTFAAPIVADGHLFFASWNGFGNSDTGTVRAYVPVPPDNTPPTVSLTAPTGGSTVSGTISVTANASDNVGVAGVQFKLDGASLGSEVTSSPYSVSWDTTTATNGTHVLTAVARDTSGNLTTSSPVTITVDNSTQPPPTKFLLGDQTIEASADSNTGGTAEAFRTTGTTTGTLSQLSVYVASTSAATKLVVGLYADSGGHPGTLLTQGTLSSPAKGAWVNVTVPAASVTAGATYWIAILSPSGAGTIQFRDKSGGGASETSSSSTLTALPATWTTGARYTDGPLSAYGSGN